MELMIRHYMQLLIGFGGVGVGVAAGKQASKQQQKQKQNKAAATTTTTTKQKWKNRSCKKQRQGVVFVGILTVMGNPGSWRYSLDRKPPPHPPTLFVLFCVVYKTVPVTVPVALSCV